MRNEKKEFYRQAAFLVIPMAIQNLINVGISSIDVIMLGRVGETVLAGASLGSQIQFILSLIYFGLTSGAAVLSAQYWGKGDTQSIEKIFAIALKAALGVGAIFTLAACLIPNELMSIFTDNPAVMAQGSAYLRVVCLSYLFIGISMVYLNTLRSVGEVKIATYVYFTSMMVNIVVNAVLIFGYFGAPALGVVGAAVGTVCARAVEVLIVIWYDRRRNTIFRFRKGIFTGAYKDRALAKDFMKYSIPVVANELMWGAGVSCISAILGHMGSAAVAANSVAQVVRQLATVVAFGVSSAAAIMIGKAIGEQKVKLAKVYGKRFLFLSLLTGLLGSVVILVVRPVLLSTMALSQDAVGYLSKMLFIMCYFVLCQSYNSTAIVGIFRGGGDTKFGFWMDTIVLWGIAIVSGAIAAFYFQAGVVFVYMLLLSDEVIKIPITTLRYRTYKWLNNITRD